MTAARHILVDLDDTHLMLAHLEDDVRGRRVVDRDGHMIGRVDHLLVDEADRHVRFLEVGRGGFLGFGKRERFIPAEAVTGLDVTVHVDLEQGVGADHPAYDPELVEAPEDLGFPFGFDGYVPYRAPGRDDTWPPSDLAR
jgi:sporulation protein YlmC with PRC-barrel domain